jgi:hypothetical protein
LDHDLWYYITHSTSSVLCRARPYFSGRSSFSGHRRQRPLPFRHRKEPCASFPSPPNHCSVPNFGPIAMLFFAATASHHGCGFA